MNNYKLLMIPGPTEVSTEALLAMAQPTIPHYGDDWVKMNSRIIGKIKKVFQTKDEIYIIPGSASAAMETAVNAVIEPGDEVLVELSGFLSYRFKEIVEGYGGKPITVEFEWGKPVQPSKIKETLKKHPKIKVMTFIHNETSTGITNPAKEIGEICKESGVIFICDTVSSMGGIEVKVDEWGIDLCMTGNQKCLQSPPGLGILSVSSNVWKKIKKRKTPIHGWFLNLENIRAYCEKWANRHPQGPVTAPTAIYAALEVALDDILEEGLEKRFERHRINAEAFRNGLKSAGIKLFADEKFASNTVTPFLVPDGINAQESQKFIEKEFGIMISHGQDKLAGKILRVGHMGITADKKYIMPTLAAIIFAFCNQGVKLDIDKAIKEIGNTYHK